VDNSANEVLFKEDLMNIARTTLSSKLLNVEKDHFASLAVEAVLRLKGSGNLDHIQVSWTFVRHMLCVCLLSVRVRVQGISLYSVISVPRHTAIELIAHLLLYLPSHPVPAADQEARREPAGLLAGGGLRAGQGKLSATPNPVCRAVT
jgi:hypothetical protein